MTVTEPVTFLALGTTATVLTTAPQWLGEAVSVVKAELDAIDHACSRFRPDSELDSGESGRRPGGHGVTALLRGDRRRAAGRPAHGRSGGPNDREVPAAGRLRP